MPFVKAALRFAVASCIVFTGLNLILHTFPPAYNPIWTMLGGSEACPAPCFMGIRPGITQADDALAYLEKSGWSGYAEGANFDNSIEFFTWRAQHPEVTGSWEWASFGIEDNIVMSLRLPTRLRLGDMLALYGEVEWWSLNGDEAYAGYHRYGFTAQFMLPRETHRFRTMIRFLWSPVTLHYLRAES